MVLGVIDQGAIRPRFVIATSSLTSIYPVSRNFLRACQEKMEYEIETGRKSPFWPEFGCHESKISRDFVLEEPWQIAPGFSLGIRISRTA